MEEKFKSKYCITSDTMKPEDVQLVMNKMGITSISPDKLNEIYKELDINHDGVVTVEEFVETVLSKTGEEDEIYKQLLHGMATTSEIIMYKLQKLKQNESVSKDEKAVKEIDWILSNMNSEIFEPHTDFILKPRKEEMDTMLSYSNVLNIHKRNQDCKTVNEKSGSINKFFEKKNSSHFLFRTPSNYLPPHIEGVKYTPEQEKAINEILNNLTSIDFDVFKLDEVAKTQTLNLILNRIFEELSVFGEIIDFDKYIQFITAITNGYDRNVIYHNDVHASDVLQTAYTNLVACDIVELLKLNMYDVIALCVACACHDFKHNGFTNLFHQNEMTILSLTYNDQSILENFHVAETFKIIHKEEYNLFCKLSKEEFRHIRRRMINCILATDMANHPKMSSELKNRTFVLNIVNGKNNNLLLGNDEKKYYENQQQILNLLIHSSDISNPTKPDHIYDKMVELVMKEFFLQGDVEKKEGLPISPLCDRDTTSIPGSQIGFMSFVVLPSFELFHNIFPEVEPYLNQLKKNLERYKKLAEEEKNKK